MINQYSKSILIIIPLIIFQSCGLFSTKTVDLQVEKLSAKGETVKIGKFLPNLICKEKGEVVAHVVGETFEIEKTLRGVRNLFRNRAGDFGGNYAVIESDHTYYYYKQIGVALMGTSYLCLQKPTDRTKSDRTNLEKIKTEDNKESQL